jgi:hypothetical protein
MNSSHRRSPLVTRSSLPPILPYQPKFHPALLACLRIVAKLSSFYRCSAGFLCKGSLVDIWSLSFMLKRSTSATPLVPVFARKLHRDIRVVRAALTNRASTKHRYQKHKSLRPYNYKLSPFNAFISRLHCPTTQPSLLSHIVYNSSTNPCVWIVALEPATHRTAIRYTRRLCVRSAKL